MALFQIENVKKTYGKVHALRGVNLTLEGNSQYVICGASGSGKSTLLYLLGGLDRPSEGRILVEGKDLSSYDDESLARYRNLYVGFVFQFHFLLPSMNCMNNIMLPAQIGGATPSDLKENVQVLAEKLGVTHCLKKYPYELSGGEQQRVNIIRALSLRPKLLLCDEPTGNLDSENSMKVTSLLKQLATEYQSTLVVVTHDDKVAAHFDNKISMVDGSVV
ncbi:MAG: ABC transporter ATP-binding protein [Deltaproteobacteria bacterium]|nr:MAG: ABC transporter ATP-binding protein [Deltaproteobacteria bacterium]